MKKSTLLSLALLLGIACKKDVKYCWVCTTLNSVSSPGAAPKTDSSKNTLCDKTQSEINDYIKNGHSQFTSGQTVITRTVLYCGKQ